MKKNTQLVFVLVLWLYLISGISAQNSQYLIPLDSDLYGQIEKLYLENGLSQPNTTRPWTQSEALDLLKSIDRTSLSERSLELYSNLENDLSKSNARPEDSDFTVNFDLTLSLETYLRGNNAINWLYDYNDRKGLISLAPHFFLNDTFYMGGTVDLLEEPLAIEQSGNWSNYDFNFLEYDFQFPFKAYASVGEDFWNISLGRSEASFGPGKTGKLTISDEPHWLDNLRYSIWNDYFKYTGMVIYFSPWLLSGEAASIPTNESGWFEESKYLGIHRFDVRPFHWLNIGITEGLMWGGKYPDLRLFNPVMIFHNFYEWDYSASLFAGEIDITPFPYFNFYGQIAWNAIQTAFEISQYTADSIPGAMAGMVGARMELPVDNLWLSSTVEFVHTDPWFNIREHALISYTWRRRVLSNLYGTNTVITTPLSYTWGNDSNVFYVDFGMEVIDQFKAELGFTYVSDGVKDLDEPYDDGAVSATEQTPTSSGSQVPSEYFIISVMAELDFLKFLIFTLHTDIISVNNVNYVSGSDATDVQFVFSIDFILEELLESL